MSEISAGTYECNFTSVDLYGDILEYLFLEYKRAASDKNLELTLVKETDNTVLYLDEYTVNQIFSHLIDNALTYTQKGKVEIKISEDINNKIRVSVSDTGIGISSDFLPNLFKPFTQEEQGYTRKYEGNGLGLSLVKKYCELNNAEISVDSTKNRGTTFTIEFSTKQVNSISFLT